MTARKAAADEQPEQQADPAAGAADPTEPAEADVAAGGDEVADEATEDETVSGGVAFALLNGTVQGGW